MVPIRVKMEDLDTTILPLGFLGENLHKEIIINCKQAFDLYPDAVPSLTVLMPDGYAYPAVIERQGEDIIWELTASDLSKVGAGEIQLSFVQDEVIMLSVAGHTYCSRAIVPKGAVPDPVANWILQAQQIIASIPGDINAALAAAKASGEFDGADGVGIVSITKIGSFGLVDTYRILLSNDNHYDYDVTNGAPGNDGVGIASIAKTGTSGLVDTYTITLTNGQHYDFTVTNGQDGQTPTVPVQDVQVNDVSVLNNGVAKIPLANGSMPGVGKVNGGSYGIDIGTTGNHVGFFRISPATSAMIKAGADYYHPTSVQRQHESAFYALAKLAGVDLANETVTVGQYPDSAKIAIQKMLGLVPVLGQKELIRRYVVPEDSANVVVDVDSNGLPFSLGYAQIIIRVEKTTTGTADYISSGFFDQNSLERSMPTMKPLSPTASKTSWLVYEVSIVNGLAKCLAKSSNTGNAQSAQFATYSADNYLNEKIVPTIEAITGVKFKQYNQTSTLIPAGSEVIIYGCRIL